MNIKNESSVEVEKIDSDLKDIQGRISHLTDAVERGYDKDIASNRIKEYISKRDRLLDIRSEASKKTAPNLTSVESINLIMGRMKNFKKEFENAEIPAKKMLLAKFIHEIKVDPNEKRCYYYMKKIPSFFGGEASREGLSVKFGEYSAHHLLPRTSGRV